CVASPASIGAQQSPELLPSFFQRQKKKPFWKEIQTVRQQTSATDYALICELAEGNAAYPFPGLGNTYPNSERATPNSAFRLLKPLTECREVELQVARLNHHKARLSSALESLALVNERIASHELEQADATIAAHKEAHGLSLVILKKELLLALERHGLPGLFK